MKKKFAQIHLPELKIWKITWFEVFQIFLKKLRDFLQIDILLSVFSSHTGVNGKLQSLLPYNVLIWSPWPIEKSNLVQNTLQLDGGFDRG